MNEDKVFALTTVLLSSFFSLLVTLLTNWAIARKEDKTFKRQLQKERIETTRTLYQDALYVLGIIAKQEGRADQDTLKELVKLRSRLPLLASRDIQEQFQKTAEAFDAGLHEYIQSQPEDAGEGFKMIRSGMKYSEHQEEANKLFQIYETELEKLGTMMATHLKTMEKEHI